MRRLYPTEFFNNELLDPKELTPEGATVRVIVTGNPLLKPEVAYEWSYGAVYSPKWINGLTLSADFWHIDLRSIASLVDPQFIIDHENFFPQDVIRDPTTGVITSVINPNLNLTRAVVEGLDYEAIYILDSSIFSRGDFGKFAFTLNGTYLSRFEFQASPDSPRIGLSGGFPVGLTFSGSLPHTRAFARAFYNGPLTRGSPASMLARPFTTPASIRMIISTSPGRRGVRASAKYGSGLPSTSLHRIRLNYRRRWLSRKWLVTRGIAAKT
jgi:outer membrane receptor protein involved in Fe transport